MGNGLPAGTDEVLEAAAISVYLRGDDPPNPRAFGGEVSGKWRPLGPPMVLWVWSGPPHPDRAGA
jgi:hypothetical protein